MKQFYLHTISILVVLLLIPSAVNALVVNVPAAQDNTLYENATGAVSNRAGDFVFTGRTREGVKSRAVMRFDIAANIPAGSTINSVTLYLYMSRSKENTLYNTSLYLLLTSASGRASSISCSRSCSRVSWFRATSVPSRSRPCLPAS